MEGRERGEQQRALLASAGGSRRREGGRKGGCPLLIPVETGLSWRRHFGPGIVDQDGLDSVLTSLGMLSSNRSSRFWFHCSMT